MTFSDLSYYLTDELMHVARVFGPGLALAVVSVWIARGIAR